MKRSRSLVAIAALVLGWTAGSVHAEATKVILETGVLRFGTPVVMFVTRSTGNITPGTRLVGALDPDPANRICVKKGLDPAGNEISLPNLPGTKCFGYVPLPDIAKWTGKIPMEIDGIGYEGTLLTIQDQP